MIGLAAPVPTTGGGVGVGVGEGVAVATIDVVGLDVGVPADADGVPQAATALQMQTLPSTTADLRITPLPSWSAPMADGQSMRRSQPALLVAPFIRHREAAKRHPAQPSL
jgi:hypothetical protein